MSIAFEISPELAQYSRDMETWGKESIRPLARQADTEHALPKDYADILDTSPVPLNRNGRPDDAFPEFPDGAGVRGLAFFESVSYCDIWLLESLNIGIGHMVVEAIGTPEQTDRWYRPILEQGGKTGFGMSEPGVGSDTSNLATTATRDGDQWIINGTKMYCSLGAQADYIVVFATVDKSAGRGGIRAFVVEKGNPGMHVVRRNEDKLGLRCWMTSQMAFDDCAVPSDCLLGWSRGSKSQPPQGLSVGLAKLNFNRPNVSAISLGLARASLDTTKGILTSQRSGFAPHRWRAIEDDLERMAYALHRARLMARRAKRMEDMQLQNRGQASMAKAFAPPTAELVIRRCMQLLGPDGASTDLLIEKWYRDCKILDIFEGTGQIMRVLIGRELATRSAGDRA